MSEDVHWDHDVEGDAVVDSLDRVGRDVIVQVINEMENVRSPVPTDVSLELIAARMK